MRIPALALLTGLAFCPIPAFAQDSSALLERLLAADANGDGVISRAEMIAFRGTNFARIDRNSDGYLTDHDIPALLRRRGGPIDFAALKAQFDSNHDGRVSRDEFVNGPMLVFDRADSNHDGLLSQVELTAAIAVAKAKER